MSQPPSPLQPFPHFAGISGIYVMHLAKNPERKTALLRALHQFSISPAALNFIDAVDGREFLAKIQHPPQTPVTLDEVLRVNAALQQEKVLAQTLYTMRWHQKVNYLTLGEIGVALSATKAFHQMVKNKDAAGLLLEDDVQFNDDFPSRLAAVMVNLPPEWDVLSLSWLKHPTPQPGIEVNAELMIPYQSFYYQQRGVYLGLESLIFSKNGAKKMLRYLHPLDMPWSLKIDTLKNLGILNFYAVKVPLTRQDQTFASDIQTQVVLY